MLSLPAYRSTIARILLVLYSLMLVNGIVFRHAHKLASGRVIVHAHPYWPVGNSPYQPSTHTSQELLWLDTLTQLIYESPAILALVLVAPLLVPVAPLFRYRTSLPRTPLRCLSLRGPPQHS